MNKRHVGLTGLAAFFVVMALFCTFIVMGRADDLEEAAIRNKALTGFLLLWPLSWFTAQMAAKTSWRKIGVEAALLLPILWLLYLWFANGRTVSST